MAGEPRSRSNGAAHAGAGDARGSGVTTKSSPRLALLAFGDLMLPAGGTVKSSCTSSTCSSLLLSLSDSMIRISSACPSDGSAAVAVYCTVTSSKAPAAGSGVLLEASTVLPARSSTDPARPAGG